MRIKVNRSGNMYIPDTYYEVSINIHYYTSCPSVDDIWLIGDKPIFIVQEVRENFIKIRYQRPDKYNVESCELHNLQYIKWGSIFSCFYGATIVNCGKDCLWQHPDFAEYVHSFSFTAVASKRRFTTK